MPKCKKCEESFPQYVEIDGKIRNLQRRKFCLVCSPFGMHNTSATLATPGTEQVTCGKCGKEFIYSRIKGHRRSLCNTCSINGRRPLAKQFAIDYKGGKCVICGYHACNRAMDFHHINPEEKDFGLSQKYLTSREKLIEELDKCILLCNRCHMEVEEGMHSQELLESLYSPIA